MMNPVSILILTKNEEVDLPGCIQSISWSDDIHVLDSCSTDRTVEIAKSMGATVTQRPFDNWSSHQNWALDNLPFKHEWVVYLDADERMTPELKDAVIRAVQSPGDKIAFRVVRRDFFFDRWLKHVQTTSTYVRLFKPGSIRYERVVNPVTNVHGPAGQIEGYLDHFPFSKGIDHWFARHNSYSKLEAEQILLDEASGAKPSLKLALTADTPQERRRHQKLLFYRLPCRPFLKFLIVYVFKRGFLDGAPGFRYACMTGIYEYMIKLKVLELRAKGKR